MQRLSVLLSLLVFLGTACTAGEPVWGTPAPTLEIPTQVQRETPTEVQTETPIPTLVLETPTPPLEIQTQPLAQAQVETSIPVAYTPGNAQVLEGPGIDYNGIRFTLNPAFGSHLFVFEDVTTAGGLSAHNARFALTLGEYCQDWCLVVYHIAEFEQAFGTFVFPPHGYRGGAAVVFEARKKTLSFQNGSGVRTLETFGQSHYSVSNESLKYVFRGYSVDKQYGIFVQVPIRAASLPEVTPTMTTNAQDILEYNRQEAESMNALGSADFTPSLDLLDALVASIHVEIP